MYCTLLHGQTAAVCLRVGHLQEFYHLFFELDDIRFVYQVGLLIGSGDLDGENFLLFLAATAAMIIRPSVQLVVDEDASMSIMRFCLPLSCSWRVSCSRQSAAPSLSSPALLLSNGSVDDHQVAENQELPEVVGRRL